MPSSLTAALIEFGLKINQQRVELMAIRSGASRRWAWIPQMRAVGGASVVSSQTPYSTSPQVNLSSPFTNLTPCPIPRKPEEHEHTSGCFKHYETITSPVNITANDVGNFTSITGSVSVPNSIQNTGVIFGAVIDFAGVIGEVLNAGQQFHAVITDNGQFSQREKILTIIEAFEKSLMSLVRIGGSATNTVGQFLSPALPVAATLSNVGNGMTFGLSAVLGAGQLFSGIQEAVRLGGVQNTSLAVITLLSMYQNHSLMVSSEKLGLWFRTETAIKKSFLTTGTIPSSLAHYHWFCFKYHKTFLGYTRFLGEKLAVPLLTIAAGCLGIVAISSSIATGGIVAIALAETAAVVGCGFLNYRFSTYCQSVAAFQSFIQDNRAHQKIINISDRDERQLLACVGFSHRVFGGLLHRAVNPMTAQRGELHALGVTLGDWYRFKIAQDLLELIYENGCEQFEGFNFDPGLSSPLAPLQTKKEIQDAQKDIDLFKIEQQNIYQSLQKISSEMRFLLARGVWETIKSDVSEYSWRSAVEEMKPHLSQYAVFRQSSFAPQSTGSLQSNQNYENIETNLLKILFGLIRVNV